MIDLNTKERREWLIEMQRSMSWTELFTIQREAGVFGAERGLGMAGYVIPVSGKK